LELA
jgi:hypothetical protein